MKFCMAKALIAFYSENKKQFKMAHKCDDVIIFQKFSKNDKMMTSSKKSAIMKKIKSGN